MSDILKSVTGGNWSGLIAWILPSALFLVLFWFVVYPQMSVHYGPFDALGATEKAGVWIAAAVVLGLFLNALSTPMYRLLEGYSWPRWFSKRGVIRQRAVKADLEARNRAAGWEQGLMDEQLARFPKIETEIAPTRLGNALRAFETYGASRFGLDSQVMWTELSTVVPKYLQEELDRSRANVDFFVAFFYLSSVFGVATLAVAVETNKPLLLALGVAAIASTYLWYRMAVVSTSYWATTVQALVNLGRSKLADEMGLQIPDTIDVERDMWWAVTSFVYDNDEASAQKLDKYRKPRAASDGKAKGGGGDGDGGKDGKPDKGAPEEAERGEPGEQPDDEVEITAFVIRRD